ncbi:hypothetical protein QS306_09185 [Paraburkholderia bonniea]|uniref:hypothetical protein n=1 Tax=Paraburkholderia bonniea TaxID=2152891 RepID=UPI001291F9F1|nr:hypothetical protein [Paraburkholderia bonniea]WJF89296.1 hypothetical protein QS306_09185 [Paraburkholderia bonniea]WJF92612.1 hypothetical protein QS308_09195 [Paraburkholderia bonniea]
MFCSALWRTIFEMHRARVPALVDFALNPAHGALPSRVARALRVDADPVRATLPYDARPWSRCLLLGYADLEAASPELDCNLDMIWYASLDAAQQMHIATHLGALQLAQPLRRRVSRTLLAPFAARDMLDAVRFAQRQPVNEAFLHAEADSWDSEQLAQAMAPLGLACLHRAQSMVPPRLAWRWQLRRPTVSIRSEMDPLLAWSVSLDVARQLEPVWFS